MIRLVVIIPIIAILIQLFRIKGGFSELKSFHILKDSLLVNGIAANLFISMIFAEIYYMMDSNSNKEDFGFEEPVDSYYFSVVTSSSTGYGDVLPKTRRAKIAVMVHILTVFFIILPIVMEALKPGN